MTKQELIKLIDECDWQFNRLVEVINPLVEAAAKHDVPALNAWVDEWANEKDWTINWRKVIEAERAKGLKDVPELVEALQEAYKELFNNGLLNTEAGKKTLEAIKKATS